MKVCPKCSTAHEKPGTFCSRVCANSRVFSEEAKLKKSIALKGKALERDYVPPYDMDAWKASIREGWDKKYRNTPFDKMGRDNKRRRVFEEQNYCCNRCGISEWLGNKISLEMEHKDGNNKNDVRENLEGLCPNCHSLTHTWRGRNIPLIRKRTAGV